MSADKIDFDIVGKSVRRRDAFEKVTGEAVFSTDVKLPGMLYVRYCAAPTPMRKSRKLTSQKRNSCLV